MREYLKTRWQSWVMAAAMLLMAVIVLFLYDVPLEPVGYIAVLVIICETGFLIWGYRKYRKKQQNLLYIKMRTAPLHWSTWRHRRMRMRRFTRIFAGCLMRKESRLGTRAVHLAQS